MNNPPSPELVAAVPTSHPSAAIARLDYLDAVRAFALVLGVVFHASLSFTPWFMGWAVQDVSTSARVGDFILVSHSFRMEAFFLIAGFFAHRTLGRDGLGAFVRSRVVRIGVPFVVGWFILRPLVVSGWTMGAASLRGDYDFWAAIGSGFRTLRELPAGIFTGSHLWFLYYLALITGLALGLRGMLHLAGGWGAGLMRGADAFVAWLARSSYALPVAAVPVAGALWFMQYWSMDTPDKSLVPHVPVLLVYGGFFAVGWGFDRVPGAIDDFSRASLARGVMAAAGIATCILLAPIQTDLSHPHYDLAHAGFALGYALMMVAMVALTFGVFRWCCARPRPVIRYVADSSYWMYLIHLPIVVWLQVAVAEVELNWSLKLAFVTVATVAIALVSYDLFVRSTFLGAMLNGHRRARVLLRWRGKAGPSGSGT